MGQPGKLPPGYEPSGAAWHAGRQELVIVGDGGQVTAMDRDGGQMTTWQLWGDLEAVAVADPGSSLVYLGLEQPDMVLEFDLTTGQLTGEQWDLTPWMTGPSNEGLEALTFAEGLFLAGLQSDGRIFRFDLQPGGVVVPGSALASHLGRGDLSGLHYEPATAVLYAIHDSYDAIVEYDAQGVFLREYALAGDNQEGVTLAPCCPGGAASIFLAEDSGEVWRYEGYPILCAHSLVYCTAKLNSQGCLPAIGYAGYPSASDPAPFVIGATQVVNNKNGLLFYGLAGRSALPFQGGLLCVKPPFRRTPIQSSGGNPPPADCSGSFAFDFNAWMQAGADPGLAPGVRVNGQHWYRDPASPSTTGLTDAIEFEVCP